MRALILQSLKSAIEPSVAEDLLRGYEKLVAEYRKGDAEAALNACGKFVEHVLRAIEFVRTGKAPGEIKSVAAAIKDIEKDATLSESLRILVPRVASSMMFDVRSKRGAAHVKEIDPRQTDAALAAQAASWVMSEFMRLYHVGSEREVAEAMAALMRGNVPLIEQFGDELVITTPIGLDAELLLHLFSAEPDGLNRSGISTRLKKESSTVSKAIKRLEVARHVHQMKSGVFRITGPGEAALADKLVKIGATTSVAVRR